MQSIFAYQRALLPALRKWWSTAILPAGKRFFRSQPAPIQLGLLGQPEA